jgi:hypothetical protein
VEAGIPAVAEVGALSILGGRVRIRVIETRAARAISAAVQNKIGTRFFAVSFLVFRRGCFGEVAVLVVVGVGCLTVCFPGIFLSTYSKIAGKGGCVNVGVIKYFL